MGFSLRLLLVVTELSVVGVPSDNVKEVRFVPIRKVRPHYLSEDDDFSF